ncbi:hypothetical protein P5Y53_15615 [Dyella jiangningensis]|uniref:hypothetical protein n=1 Tax=Dyella jiangningensis TaxID=1379159 RepID=UPI00240EE0A6|nr:hypothetical protein [Dyella jiangningensis]MDG2539105.1 hypothetical protein [Dyella jiangningensis]
MTRHLAKTRKETFVTTKKFAILASALLAGCASSGTKVDPRVVSTFQPGITTIAQVEAELGKPNASTRLPDGSIQIVYAYTHKKGSGSWIPFVGAFRGHADANTVTESLTFDQTGLFVQATSSTSQAQPDTLSSK